MEKDSLTRILLIAFCIILLCSTLVTSVVLLLKPMQLAAKAPEQYKTILKTASITISDENDNYTLSLFQVIEPQLLDLRNNRLVPGDEETNYEYQSVMHDETATSKIEISEDLALLARRPDRMPVYWVHHSDSEARLVLPIFGKGMWSLIHGYIALADDLNTIVGIEFYQMEETPGIGDKIQERDWLNTWVGKKIYDENQQLVFTIGSESGSAGRDKAIYQVDGISGATITVTGVKNMMAYWFGKNGYGPFLNEHRNKISSRIEQWLYSMF